MQIGFIYNFAKLTNQNIVTYYGVPSGEVQALTSAVRYTYLPLRGFGARPLTPVSDPGVQNLLDCIEAPINSYNRMMRAKNNMGQAIDSEADVMQAASIIINQFEKIRLALKKYTNNQLSGPAGAVLTGRGG